MRRQVSRPDRPRRVRRRGLRRHAVHDRLRQHPAQPVADRRLDRVHEVSRSGHDDREGDRTEHRAVQRVRFSRRVRQPDGDLQRRPGHAGHHPRQAGVGSAVAGACRTRFRCTSSAPATTRRSAACCPTTSGSRPSKRPAASSIAAADEATILNAIQDIDTPVGRTRRGEALQHAAAALHAVCVHGDRLLDARAAAAADRAVFQEIPMTIKSIVVPADSRCRPRRDRLGFLDARPQRAAAGRRAPAAGGAAVRRRRQRIRRRIGRTADGAAADRAGRARRQRRQRRAQRARDCGLLASATTRRSSRSATLAARLPKKIRTFLLFAANAAFRAGQARVRSQRRAAAARRHRQDLRRGAEEQRIRTPTPPTTTNTRSGCATR